MRTRNRVHRLFGIYFFVFSALHVLTVHGYGDLDNLSVENNNGTLEAIFYEPVVMLDRHPRVRRAVGNPGTPPSQVTLASTATNSSPIYIISSFSFPSITTLQTSVSPVQATSQSTSSSTYTTTTAIYLLPTTTTASISCTNASYFLLPNGTCASRTDTQISTISILRNPSSNDTDKANALSLYLASITNLTTPLNASTTLGLGEIDNITGSLQTPNLIVNTSTSIIFSVTPNANPDDNLLILGGSFQQNVGGQIVDTVNQLFVINTNISVAGVFTPNSVVNATSMSVVIISDSSAYANVDNVTNRTLASSIVSAKLRQGSVSISGPLQINLFFQVLPSANPTPDANFLCVFYDDNTTLWNDFGCTIPTYNPVFARYECQCNHLSSFALVWLPKSSTHPTNGNTSTPVTWDPDDIASLVFQSLSIACFLGVVIHGIVMRVTQPSNFTAPRNLFPLLSCAVTMVLFVFYIALSMSVFNRFYYAPANSAAQGRSFESKDSPLSTTQAPNNEDVCLPQENSLAFTTYFFLILMFCIKTGSGYLNYEHFVRLFPPPSKTRLLVMFAVSFLISIFLVSLAAGLNSNPSNKITQIAAKKVCWFSGGVIHYFLTIPICLFLALNIIVIVLVARRMILYARAPPESSKRSQYIRRKRCVILILSSCVTQGVGWLFGPLISIANPTVGNVLVWFFIIFNGLEGLWAIILYIFIRKEGLDEDRRAVPAKRPSVIKLDRDDDSPSIRRSDRRRDVRNQPEFDDVNNRVSNESRAPFTDIAEIGVIYNNESYHYEDDEERHDL